MEYVDLHTGFAMLGFKSYTDYTRAKQLCRDRNKAMVYYGDLSKLKEIQARHWAKKVTRGGFMDYQYPVSEYEFYDGIHTKRIGVKTGVEALATAARVLELKQSNKVKYIIIARK